MSTYTILANGERTDLSIEKLVAAFEHAIQVVTIRRGNTTMTLEKVNNGPRFLVHEGTILTYSKVIHDRNVLASILRAFCEGQDYTSKGGDWQTKTRAVKFDDRAVRSESQDCASALKESNTASHVPASQSLLAFSLLFGLPIGLLWLAIVYFDNQTEKLNHEAELRREKALRDQERVSQKASFTLPASSRLLPDAPAGYKSTLGNLKVGQVLYNKSTLKPVGLVTAINGNNILVASIDEKSLATSRVSVEVWSYDRATVTRNFLTK